MQRRAAEESLTDHGKDNSNGRAHVGDAIRHKPGILGFLRQIGFMGATRSAMATTRRLRSSAAVPRSILYDNTKLAVARILGDGKRQRTRVFTELQSHYLFEDRFGRPGKGNDKGKVEGLVGFIRRNFLVPVPRAESFAALNDALRRTVPPAPGGAAAGPCKETIGERLERDRQVLLPLPPAPYDACDKRPGSGEFAVAGALPQQRLFRARGLRPP